MGRKAAAAPEVTPKPRRMPDLNGVPGEIVSLDGLGLVFGSHQRKSPYDPLLDQLAQAGPGKVLRFGDARARFSLAARAKKKGLRISFAEQAGVLYVRYDGSVEDDVKGTRRERILGALKLAPSTAMKLAGFLRAKGDEHADAQLVEAICVQMMRAGEIVKREGNEWGLNPAKKAA